MAPVAPSRRATNCLRQPGADDDVAADDRRRRDVQPAEIGRPELLPVGEAPAPRSAPRAWGRTPARSAIAGVPWTDAPSATCQTSAPASAAQRAHRTVERRGDRHTRRTRPGWPARQRTPARSERPASVGEAGTGPFDATAAQCAVSSPGTGQSSARAGAASNAAAATTTVSTPRRSRRAVAKPLCRIWRVVLIGRSGSDRGRDRGSKGGRRWRSTMSRPVVGGRWSRTRC